MNKDTRKKRFPWLEVLFYSVIALVVLSLITPCRFKAIDRAALAEAMNNVR